MAVRVVDSPGQIEAGDAVTLILNVGLTVMVVDAVAEHPLEARPVTE
jgi:hypothetical protein